MSWVAPIKIATITVAAIISPAQIVHAQSPGNYGNDPFVRVSSAIAGCPEPAGPRVSQDAWKREAHHRIEEGNHCYMEGRCRLPNAYQYDHEIAESLTRRLDDLRRTLPAWQNSSLWITVRGRWLTVQGCVPPGFDHAAFLAAMRQIPDVEKVIDQTTATPARGVPYARYPSSSAPGASNTPNR